MIIGKLPPQEAASLCLAPLEESGPYFLGSVSLRGTSLIPAVAVTHDIPLNTISSLGYYLSSSEARFHLEVF